MAEKLIRLPQLQRFKQKADLKYQDKLTAGSNITISNNVISAQTTVGDQAIYNATITAAGWSGTSNTVSVQGILAGDDIEIVGINPTGLTSQQIQAAKEDLYLITYGTTSAGAITFYALNGLPVVDIPVTIRKIVNGSLSDGVYGNTNFTEYGINAPANATTDIYTATGNCKVYITAELKTITENANGDAHLNLNGTSILSCRLNPSQSPLSYPRIFTSTVLMEAGDVLSILNPWSSTLIQGNYKVVPAGPSNVSSIEYSAGSNITISNGVISATYSAGDNISINNGVISADLSSVYDNSHADPAGDSHYVQCPTGSTTNIFTATRNCKLTISLQVNDAVNSGRNARINLNGAEAYSFYSTAIKWQRIGHAFLILKTGDVVSVYNDYGVMMDAKIGVYY